MVKPFDAPILNNLSYINRPSESERDQVNNSRPHSMMVKYDNRLTPMESQLEISSQTPSLIMNPPDHKIKSTSHQLLPNPYQQQAININPAVI